MLLKLYLRFVLSVDKHFYENVWSDISLNVPVPMFYVKSVMYGDRHFDENLWSDICLNV